MTRITGAAIPIVLKDGSRPMIVVATPMITNELTNMVLRPSLSPKWPMMIAPSGRAM